MNMAVMRGAAAAAAAAAFHIRACRRRPEFWYGGGLVPFYGRACLRICF